MQYIQDNKDYFPPHDLNQWGYYDTWIAHLRDGYLDKISLGKAPRKNGGRYWDCPAIPNGSDASWQYSDYTMNKAFTWSDTANPYGQRLSMQQRFLATGVSALKITEILVPSNVFAYFDRAYKRQNYIYAESWAQGHFNPVVHSKGFNAAHVDGHASYYDFNAVKDINVHYKGKL